MEEREMKKSRINLRIQRQADLDFYWTSPTHNQWQIHGGEGAILGLDQTTPKSTAAGALHPDPTGGAYRLTGLPGPTSPGTGEAAGCQPNPRFWPLRPQALALQALPSTSPPANSSWIRPCPQPNANPKPTNSQPNLSVPALLFQHINLNIH